jgi:hypothetical protein
MPHLSLPPEVQVVLKSLPERSVPAAQAFVDDLPQLAANHVKSLGHKDLPEGVHEFRTLAAFPLLLKHDRYVRIMVDMVVVSRGIDHGRKDWSLAELNTYHRVAQFKRCGFTPDPKPLVYNNNVVKGKHRICWMLANSLPCLVEVTKHDSFG